MRFLAAAVLLCAFFMAPAEARQNYSPECNVTMPCELSAPAAQKRARVVRHSAPAAQKPVREQPRTYTTSTRLDTSKYITSPQVVAHPDGCPRKAFCGCGAAVRIFGKPVRELWLAANWFKFPRAAPAPHMAAVTRHHVFVLLEPRGGPHWLVYDANSGGHLTRVHVRSIAGYTIVNPGV